MNIHMNGEIELVFDTLYPFAQSKQSVTKSEAVTSVTQAVTAALEHSGETLSNAVVTVNTLNSNNRVEKVFCRVDKKDSGEFHVENITYGGVGVAASDLYWGTAFSDEPMYNDDEQLDKVLSGSLGDINVSLYLEQK